MSEESGEKTEQPTPKKTRDARDKGQVARSQEVVTTISLMSVIAYIWLTWDITFFRLIGLMDQMAALHGTDFRASAFQAIDIAFHESIIILLPLLGVVIVSGYFSNYVQFGSIFAMENLIPKLENVSPAKGFKKIFSLKQVVEVLKSVLKIVFLSVLLFLVASNAILPYVNSVYCGMACMNSVTGSIMLSTLLYSALAFVIVAVFDFMFQRSQHTKTLMMSKEEVKREYKESEGDPMIKGQRKQLAQELVMSDGIERTTKSTALVVNPTHFAVAIDYRPDVMLLPVVVAKGQNLYAAHLREQAERSGVPVFRNVPLARSLYADTNVNEYVPDDLFDAVAEILTWVSHNKHTLYKEKLEHGVLDMEAGDHKIKESKKSGLSKDGKTDFNFE